MIVLRDVSKTFGKKTVLDHCSLTINPGEFVCIVGESGAGKTTLLELLIGAQRATGGSIFVDDVDLYTLPPPVLQLYRRRTGCIFQDERLIPHRTVAENCALPLEACGWSDAAIQQRVEDVLRILGLMAVSSALPSDLSGSERAGVAIARAIAHEPMILLADEPLANLDARQTAAVVQIFRQMHQSGATVVLATHDLPLAQSLQGRMVELKNGHLNEVVPAGAGTQAAKHQILARTETSAESAAKRTIKVTAIHS